MIDLSSDVRLTIRFPIAGMIVLNASAVDGDGDIGMLGWADSDIGDPGAPEYSDGPGDGLNYEWVTYTCDTTEINIRRGVNMWDNIFGRYEAGTMTAVVKGTDLDPMVNEYMSPVALAKVEVLDTTWKTIFFGAIRGININYTQYSEDQFVVLTAYDGVERYSNIDAYSLTEQNLTSRIMTLAEFADGSVASVTGGAVTLAPVETLRSIWEQMNIAVNTDGGLMYLDRAGDIRVKGRNAPVTADVIEFSDVHSADPLHSCYTALDVTLDTNRTINSLSVTNVSEADLSGVDIEESLDPYTDPDSIDLYGAHNIQVLTNFADPADADELATYVFTTFGRPQRMVDNLSFIPDDTSMALIDIGDYVNVVYKTMVNDSYLVTSVNHQISPSNGWSTTLNLFKKGS